VYLRQDASDFVEFDPVTSRFKVLASGRSQEKRSALDGQPYTITGMAADTNHQCLWFALGGTARYAERNGLWKFLPVSGQFQQVTHENYSFDRFDFVDGKIYTAEVPCGSLNWYGLFALDPGTLELTTLVRQKNYGPARKPSLFGDIRTPLWPCAWSPAGLLVGGGQVFLLKDASAEPKLVVKAGGEPLKDVRFLHQIGERTIAVTSNGDLWVIRPGG
jgi:hypothetical protein